VVGVTNCYSENSDLAENILFLSSFPKSESEKVIFTLA
jgi:hypothetical protein